MFVDVRDGYKFVKVLAAGNSQIPKQIFDVRITAWVWECLAAGGRGERTVFSSYKVGCQFYFKSDPITWRYLDQPKFRAFEKRWN